jgi:hypothetical protein
MTKSPQQAALEYAQTSLEANRDESAVTLEMIKETVDAVLRLPKAMLDASKVDRGLLIEVLEERYSVWIGRTVALEQNDDHVAWLTPERERKFRLWKRYRQYLERGWSTFAVEALDEATREVISRLEDPQREGRWDRRGLVVGHVQSGKTANYTGLICKAADAGYKVIVVLAGLHNNLRSQTQIRLDEGFLGYDTEQKVFVGVGEIDRDSDIRPNYVTTRGEKGDFKRAVGRNFGISPTERPMLFVVKKNTSVLKNLIRWIDGILDGRKSFSDVPLLVVDDEADHASVDTKAQSFDEDGKPDEDHDPTKINQHIRTLLLKFDKSAYVGYTATPFANVFIHDQGWTTKYGTDLFPRSFIINLPAASNYDGPVRLFGLEETEDFEGTPALPLLRTVEDHAASLDPKETSGWMPPAHKSGWHPRYEGADAPPPSLHKAILSFVLTCAARRARGQVKVHNSMLVHVTRFTSVQKMVRAQVETEVKWVRNRLRVAEGKGAADELRQLWEEDYAPTMARVRDLMPGRVFKPLSWIDVESHLLDVVESTHVRTINGTAGDILDYETHRDNGFTVIAIGGDKLARGLTLEGLSVSYFLRASKMYDTLMQMGRWFGFRPGYLDLCRLYTTSELNEWFVHITQAAEELRREFDHMHAVNGTPKDYGIRVCSHPTMMVTSKVKMRSATEVQIDFAGAIQETVTFARDEAAIRSNMSATEALLEAIGQPTEHNPVRARTGRGPDTWEGTRLWSGVAGREIVSFLQDYRTHETAVTVNSLLLAKFVENQIGLGELTDWTVALFAGDGGKAKLGGYDIDLIKRSANTRSKPLDVQEAQGVALIGRLLAPRDEAIDFGAAEYDEALTVTRNEWVPDPARSQRREPPDAPSGPGIRKVRGKSPQHGLLLLYPLKGAVLNLKTALPVLGFGLSFPGSKNSKPVTYVVNNVYYEQEYGAGAW